MNEAAFGSLRCRLFEPEQARTATHREVLLVLAQTFDREGVAVLCEPSVVRGHAGTPDLVVVDPESGVHVVEVKGVTLDRVRAVHPGGAIEIEYASGTRRRSDPSKQARAAMFDVKDAAARHFLGDLAVPFQFWVVFPRVSRAAWEERFGETVSTRPEVLFADDLDSSGLAARLAASGRERLSVFGLSRCPKAQLESVMAAFGDSAVLTPLTRYPAGVPEGSRAERLAEEQAEYRALSEAQRRIVARVWDGGPRLVRGVAGSGKTVVLAAQVARMVERLHKVTLDLFGAGEPPRPVLAVCFNRTLVPFIRARIEAAYGQRTGEPLPEGAVEVRHFNGLMSWLAEKRMTRYHRIEDVVEREERARRYLADLPDDWQSGRYAPYHAVFVDEGQDFVEPEFRLLLGLAARGLNDQPRLFVFYDDAQNLYGHQRPTWSRLGIEVRGRTVVMDESLRSTRQIVEPAFNLLLGLHAERPECVETRSFADAAALEEKRLVERAAGHARVSFAPRIGEAVQLVVAKSPGDELTALASRLTTLTTREQVRPHDMMIVTYTRRRAHEIAAALRRERHPVHDALELKDDLATQPDHVTVSTVASAKGYDAAIAIVASANEFPETLEGRLALYVACTRAREWLEVSSYGTTPLVAELRAAVAATT